MLMRLLYATISFLFGGFAYGMLEGQTHISLADLDGKVVFAALILVATVTAWKAIRGGKTREGRNF